MRKHMREKANIRESAEVIVPESTSREGPNVKVMRIAASKVGAVRNRKHAHEAGTYACRSIAEERTVTDSFTNGRRSSRWN